MTASAAFQRCCQSIIGCMLCVEELYRGETGSQRRCPKCQTVRGLSNLCDIHGLDDLLNGLSYVAYENKNNNSDNELPDLN